MRQSYTVAEATLPEESEKVYKTLSLRLFPQKEPTGKQLISEHTQIQNDMEIFRYYCNLTRDVLTKYYHRYRSEVQKLNNEVIDEKLYLEICSKHKEQLKVLDKVHEEKVKNAPHGTVMKTRKENSLEKKELLKKQWE